MMLGKRQEGFKIALNVLNIGRAKLAAGIIDSARRIIDLSVKYANERIQFGVPIITFDAIKEKIARMSALTYVGESGIYRLAHDIDNRIESFMEEGMSREEAEKKAFEDFAVEAAILKVFVSDKAQEVADEGIQIYGGMGFSEETPMESFWRDSRITRIYEGTNEINRLVIIGLLMKKTLKGQLDLMTPAMAVAKELTSIPSFDKPDFSEPLAQSREMIEKLKKLFLMVAGSAVQKLGDKLAHHELVVMNAADILINIYMAESALLATLKNMQNHPDKNYDTEIAMVDYFVYHAVEESAKKAREIILNIASGDEQKVMLMGVKRFTKYDVAPDVFSLIRKIADRVSKEGKYYFNGY